MNNELTINKLRTKLDRDILPLITSDYVLWGLPYYINPGDTLIWEGTISLLKGCKYKCIDSCGSDEYVYKDLSKETVILIMGGGYFGDVWRNAWDNVMNTITLYKDNPIVILPQSIYYQDKDVAIKDAQRLSICTNLTICTRDQNSFEFAKEMFPFSKAMLEPDMAFHAESDKLMKWAVKSSAKSLYLERKDRESIKNLENNIKEDIDVSDWPMMTSGKVSFGLLTIMRIYRVLHKFKKSNLSKFISRILMYYWQRKVVIRQAVKFISQYNTIYTTRLHAMIFALHLNKKIYILDNNYGKVSGCYETWLRGCDNVQMYH